MTQIIIYRFARNFVDETYLIRTCIE